MIKYILNNKYGSLIFYKKGEVQTRYFNLTVIKKLCIQKLFTYEGYIKAFKEIFGNKKSIPIYIDNNNFFIPIMSIKKHENIWINIKAIKVIKGEHIIFFDNTKLKTSKNILVKLDETYKIENFILNNNINIFKIN